MKKFICICMFCGVTCFAMLGCGGRPAPPAGTPAGGDVTETTPEMENAAKE